MDQPRTGYNASIQYALNGPGLALRLPELLFLEVLRLYVQSGPPQLVGWLAALHDPIAGQALTELHSDPSRSWTLDELARRSACSRSTLTERFSRLVGRAPMQYLADWRLQLAAELLKETTLGVSVVAYRGGYESDAAFNRAFKRAMGKPPASGAPAPSEVATDLPIAEQPINRSSPSAFWSWSSLIARPTPPSAQP